MTQPTITKPDRVRIAYTIIGCHFFLVCLVWFLYSTDSLLTEEFTPLMTLLTPVMALYGGTVARYIAGSIKAGTTTNKEELTIPHAHLVRHLIVAHFVLMLGLVSAKAIFNWIEFSAMIMAMSLVEISFGGYMGTILGAVYGEK